jgi:SAM-dependent methyltransferase
VEQGFEFNGNELSQISHYARVGKDYVGKRNESTGHQHFLNFWINRLLAPAFPEITNKASVDFVTLDPMCGSGESAKLLMQNLNGMLMLSDISANMLDLIDAEIAKSPKIKILNAQSARQISLEDSSVDLIFVSGGLHHVFPIIDEVLCEFFRILKPGGLFVFGEPFDGFPITRIMRRLIYEYSSKFDETSEHPFQPHELSNSLLHAGFSNIDLAPWGGIGYLASGPVNIISLFKNIKSKKFWKILFAIDLIQSKIPIFNRTCLTITGVARKK